MIMSKVLVKMGKEAVIAHIEVLSQNVAWRD
jgi:hypothetical protein